MVEGPVPSWLKVYMQPSQGAPSSSSPPSIMPSPSSSSAPKAQSPQNSQGIVLPGGHHIHVHIHSNRALKTPDNNAPMNSKSPTPVNRSITQQPTTAKHPPPPMIDSIPMHPPLPVLSPAYPFFPEIKPFHSGPDLFDIREFYKDQTNRLVEEESFKRRFLVKSATHHRVRILEKFNQSLAKLLTVLTTHVLSRNSPVRRKSPEKNRAIPNKRMPQKKRGHMNPNYDSQESWSSSTMPSGPWAAAARQLYELNPNEMSDDESGAELSLDESIADHSIQQYEFAERVDIVADEAKEWVRILSIHETRMAHIATQKLSELLESQANNRQKIIEEEFLLRQTLYGIRPEIILSMAPIDRELFGSVYTADPTERNAVFDELVKSARKTNKQEKNPAGNPALTMPQMPMWPYPYPMMTFPPVFQPTMSNVPNPWYPSYPMVWPQLPNTYQPFQVVDDSAPVNFPFVPYNGS